MPHKHQLQSDGPDQLSSSCSPAGKQCFFVEKPYKKLIRKNNLLNSKKVAFKTILQRLQRCWKVTSSVGWEDDLGERQWLELRSTFPSALNERDVFAGPFRCRWNGTRLFASVSLVGGQPMLQQYLRSKVVGWNNALSHTAETNGPWCYTASFTKKSRWVKVQKFRFCVTGSGQLPSNLQIVFFWFSRKSRRLSVAGLCSENVCGHPSSSWDRCRPALFTMASFWLGSSMGCQRDRFGHVMFSIHFASIFRASIILNHNNVVISAKARVFLRLKISSL